MRRGEEEEATTTPTFVEEHHDLLKSLHEVNVVVAVLLDLQQQAKLRQTLGGEGFQQKAVLLQKKRTALISDVDL